MNPVFSLLFIVGVPLLIINRKYKILFIMSMASILANEIYVPLIGNSRFLLASYISLLLFPFISPFFFKELLRIKFSLPRALFLEFFLLVCLALYFNFVSPLEGAGEATHFSRSVEGRSILGSIRIFSDFSILVFIVFLFKNKIIDLDYFVKTVFIIATIHVSVALFDFFLNYPIKRIFISNVYVTNRPHGFCHEPKALGRLTFGAFLMFFSLYLSKVKLPSVPRYAIVILLVGFLMSVSASTIIAGIITIFLTILMMTTTKNIKRVLIILFLFLSSLYGVSQLEVFQNKTLKKIEFAIGFITRDKRPDEPALFTMLEIFDRSAAYFFIKNPEYIWLGTGPNLVSIPATNYMSDYYDSFVKRADGLPQTIIYYFSRSGIFGMLIFISVFLKLRRRLKKFDLLPLQYLLYGIFIFTSINNQIWFWVYMGLIYGIAYYQPHSLRKYNLAI